MIILTNFHFYCSGDALATLFSALYGKLLVVMGIAFPMAEVISTYIPPSFYEVSKFMSIIYIIYIYDFKSGNLGNFEIVIQSAFSTHISGEGLT